MCLLRPFLPVSLCVAAIFAVLSELGESFYFFLPLLSHLTESIFAFLHIPSQKIQMAAAKILAAACFIAGVGTWQAQDKQTSGGQGTVTGDSARAVTSMHTYRHGQR